MKTRRFQHYLDSRKKGKPMTKSEVATHPDHKIDEDFKGYPGSPAKEKLINPKTSVEKKTAAVNVTDGEKQEDTSGKKGVPEQTSDGSGSAFTATEDVHE